MAIFQNQQEFAFDLGVFSHADVSPSHAASEGAAPTKDFSHAYAIPETEERVYSMDNEPNKFTVARVNFIFAFPSFDDNNQIVVKKVFVSTWSKRRSAACRVASDDGHGVSGNHFVSFKQASLWQSILGSVIPRAFEAWRQQGPCMEHGEVSTRTLSIVDNPKILNGGTKPCPSHDLRT
jgi:hypothetical protein